MVWIALYCKRKGIKQMKQPPKYLTGEIKYQITIKEGNIDLQYQDSNENRLIAFEMIRKVLVEISGIAETKNKKELDITIKYTTNQISLLGKHIIEKYKDAVPEEKKIKLLTFDPKRDKLQLFCTCKKPWGVKGKCVACGLLIK